MSEYPASAVTTAQTRQRPLIFRITPLALIAVLVLAFCITPVAVFGPIGLLVLYVLPLGLAYWIMRVRTAVDAEHVRVRTLFGSQRLAWDEIASLRLPGERSWVRAVLTDGHDSDGKNPEVPLPAVRVRDLPLLATLSAGRVGDPTAAPAEPDAGDEPDQQDETKRHDATTDREAADREVAEGEPTKHTEDPGKESEGPADDSDATADPEVRNATVREQEPQE